MLVNKIPGRLLMFGSRSTNLLHAGLYSASVAALIALRALSRAIRGDGTGCRSWDVLAFDYDVRSVPRRIGRGHCKRRAAG